MTEAELRDLLIRGVEENHEHPSRDVYLQDTDGEGDEFIVDGTVNFRKLAAFLLKEMSL